MKTRQNRESFFSKLFALYLCVILLPILCVFFILIWRNETQLTNEALDKTTKNLTYIQKYLDAELSDLSTIGTLAADNNTLHATYRDMDSYSGVEIIGELVKYRQSGAILDDIFLVYEDTDTVYSSMGTMTSKLFMSSVMYGVNKTKAPLFSSNAFRIAQYDGEHILYVFPLIKGGSGKSSLVFQINKAMLFEMADALCEDFKEVCFMTLTAEGHALYFNGGMSAEQAFDNISEIDLSKQTVSVEIGGVKFSGAMQRTKFNWTIIMLLPSEHSIWEVCIRDQFMTIALFVLMAAGAFAAFRIAMSQSRPLNQLAELDTLQPNKKTSLKSMASSLAQTRKQLLTRIDQHMELSQAQFVTLMFFETSGMTYEQIRRMAESFGIPGEGRFCVLYLQTDDTESANACRKAINKLNYGRASAIAVPIGELGALGILLHQSGDAGDINELNEQVRSCIEQLLSGAYSAGQGDFCANLLKIGGSFSQAKIASEYSITRPDDKFILYSSIKESREDNCWHRLGDIVRFCDSLRNRQKTTACDILIALMDEIRDANQSPVIVRSMCSELVIHFIRTVSEIQSDASEFLYLFNYTSIKQLERNMLEAIDMICMPDKNRRVYGELCDAVISYVKSNLNSYDLSLDSAANALGYSKTHIGRVIKENTGSTFSDFVTEMRISFVCEQLIKSDLPISEIVQQAGYIDQSSFTRKFKKLTGMTPGEYRKAHKSNTTQ